MCIFQRVAMAAAGLCFLGAAIHAPIGSGRRIWSILALLGALAGAGIAAHLHQHVVPRWLGDANFLPIIAQTKAVPELLEDARARLAAAWP